MAIYFDLEYYVPKKDRNGSYKLKFDPTRDGHLLLGGVFYQADLPTVFNPDKLQELWIWNFDNYDYNNPSETEHKLVEIINKIFEGEKPPRKSVGIGIQRSDLPTLFVKSQQYNISPDSELYRRFFSGYPIDLSSVGAGFVNKHPYGLEPTTAEILCNTYYLDVDKTPGSDVWEIYDKRQYAMISQRTRREVEQIIKLYKILEDEIR